MQELTHEELTQATPEDVEFFNKCEEGLPTMAGKNGDGLDKFGQPIPYHSGAHILRHFKDTIQIVKPGLILEIGFNMGHSSALWLALSNADVLSLDVSTKDETWIGANFLEEKYPKRFIFCLRKHFLPLPNHFDLCFIDGAHDEKSIVEDIQLTREAQIPYILFDDWYPRYGETQKAVAKFPELELVKDMNNLRLYKWQKL